MNVRSFARWSGAYGGPGDRGPPARDRRLTGMRQPRCIALYCTSPYQTSGYSHTRNEMDYLGRITIEPDKRSGKPCIRGLRITVQDVLEYLASGMTEAEILEDFPDLEPEDIRACLTFAADRERRLMAGL